MNLLGYVPDPPSDRDLPFSAVASRLAAASTSDAFVIPMQRLPKAQAGSACGANVWTRMLEILSDVAGAPMPELSAEFLYWTARQRVGEQGFDGGSYLRCNADAARIFGVPPEDVWPSVRWSVTDQPPPRAFAAAFDYRIGAHYRIPGSGDDASLDAIEQAIRALRPVACGLQVGTDFVRYDGAPAVFSAPSRSLGGHALLVVGVEGAGWDRVFTVLSSWGAWGLGGLGLARIDARYMATALDLWVATSAAEDQ